MRLLLVEDSERLQRSLRLGFTQAGFAVDVSGDGLDAIERTRQVNYDIIVLDIMIPSLDGLEVLKELRQTPHGPHIILLTAKDTVDDRVKGLQAGADDYLIKPFSFEELLARVHALCRRSYAQKSPEIKVGDFTLNMASQRFTWKEQRIDVMPREYRLLRFLLLRRGAVITRSEIEENIYSNKAEISSNAIDSSISQLRKKILATSGEALIETRRGAGYLIP